MSKRSTSAQFEEAAPIVVSTLVDEDDNSYVPGDLSLREALELAAMFDGANAIQFDTSLILNGPATIELTSGQLEIDSDVEIDGLGMDSLTIDAGGNSRVFLIDGGVTAAIRDLTITGGSSTAGAGVYTFGDLAMESVRVADNTATSQGGGIFAYGNLTLTSSIVNGNYATTSGGGIYVNDSSYTTIVDSTIDDNESYFGGGIYGWLQAGTSLNVLNSTISNNRAVGTWGIGGGLLIQSPSTTTNGVARIVNSTISNNTATYSGGIRVDGSKAHVDFINSTIAFNQGNESGGLQLSLGGTATLHNTILAENKNGAGTSDSDVYGTIDTASSHNLLGRGGSGGLTNGTNGNIVLTTGQSAGLAALDYYGGLNKTHALLAGSLAIDAGDDDVADAFDLAYDQRGECRYADGDVDSLVAADIGAFELGADEYFGSV